MGAWPAKYHIIINISCFLMSSCEGNKSLPRRKMSDFQRLLEAENVEESKSRTGTFPLSEPVDVVNIGKNPLSIAILLTIPTGSPDELHIKGRCVCCYSQILQLSSLDQKCTGSAEDEKDEERYETSIWGSENGAPKRLALPRTKMTMMTATFLQLFRNDEIEFMRRYIYIYNYNYIYW